MKIRTIARTSLVVLAICVVGAPATATGTPEAKAVLAARAWLAIVDARNYDESWQAAAGYFRNAIGQDQWRQALGPSGGRLDRCSPESLRPGRS